MKRVLKNIIVIVLVSIMLLWHIMPITSYAVNPQISEDGLIMLSIKGTNKTVTKTTTVDEIKSWYEGEHSLETTSLFGGNAYSFWVGDKYESYLYIETLENGTIFSYGSVDPSYKTNTYSYGDSYPYTARNALYGCLLSDDGKVAGGVYYNKIYEYLQGNSSQIIKAYKEAFLADQNTALLNLNKHAVPMFNGIMNAYGKSENFVEFNQEFFDKDIELKEDGSNLYQYASDVHGLNDKIYNLLGSKSNADLSYSAYYMLNPLNFAGMAKLKKYMNLGENKYAVWDYNYEKQKIIGGVYSPDFLTTEYEANDFILQTEKVILESYTTFDDKTPTVIKTRSILGYFLEDTLYTTKGREVASEYGALVNRLALCEGAAAGTNKILRRAGIPSFTVRNLSDTNHAWNMYNIDGEWSYGDNVFQATWDPARDKELDLQSKTDSSNPNDGSSTLHVYNSNTTSSSYMHLTEFPEGKTFTELKNCVSRVYLDDNYYYYITYGYPKGSIVKASRNNINDIKGIKALQTNGFVKDGDRIYYIKNDYRTIASCDLNGNNERDEKVVSDCGEDSKYSKRLAGIYSRDGYIKYYYRDKNTYRYKQDDDCIFKTISTYPTVHYKTYNDAEHKYKMYYLKNNVGVEIVKLVGLENGTYASGKIEIPEKIDGLPVIGIAKNAFNSRGLKGEVNLPSTIRFIGEYAFSNKNITNIKLNEGLKSIGDHAFERCDMTSMTIPSTVTYMGESVFYGNEKLESIVFPENINCLVNVISETTKCTNLKSVVYKNDNMQVLKSASASSGYTNYDIYVTPGSQTEKLLQKEERQIYDIKEFGNHFVKKYFSLDTTDIPPIKVVVPDELQGVPAELEDGNLIQVKYNSNNPDVVKVTSDGYGFQSTGKPGFATITAEDTDKKYGNLEYIVFSKYQGDYNLPTTNATISSNKTKVFCGDLNNNTAWDTGDLQILKKIIDKNVDIGNDNIPLYDINGDGTITTDDYKLLEDIIVSQKIKLESIPIIDISTSEDSLDTYEIWHTFDESKDYAEFVEHNYVQSLNLYPYPSNTTEQFKIVSVEIENEKIVQLEKIGEDGTIYFRNLKEGSTEAIVTTDKGISKTIYNIRVNSNEFSHIVPTVEEKDIKAGDINGNGVVDLTDYSMILRQVKGIKKLEADELERADVNGNGVVDLTDYSMVLRHVKGIKLLEE